MRSIVTRSAIAGFLASGLLASNPVSAGADMTATARDLVAGFVEAVIAGPDKVAPLLAPEYQIMRSNGVGYDRDGYINRGAGTVNAQRNYAYDDMVVTAADNILVVRYFLRIEETIDAKAIARRAPRLTVFRKIGDDWKISAHSNFAQVE
ncbi:MAG: nuclear transport factor 2 family protein [Alphaproteobacteria bacterium]|jgi:hypothetical protein|nr:nuclear transport factor 2 family protein [Alphaproteobacteria bacterium]